MANQLQGFLSPPVVFAKSAMLRSEPKKFGSYLGINSYTFGPSTMPDEISRLVYIGGESEFLHEKPASVILKVLRP